MDNGISVRIPKENELCCSKANKTALFEVEIILEWLKPFQKLQGHTGKSVRTEEGQTAGNLEMGNV